MLDKTTLYSNFLAEKLQEQQRQAREKSQRLAEKAKAQEAAATTAPAVEATITTRSGAWH